MFVLYCVSSSLIDAFLSYWEEEMAFVLLVWACIRKWYNIELESCLYLFHAKWRIFFMRELVLTVLKHAEEQCTCMPVYLSSDYITNIYISFVNQAKLHIIYIYSLDYFSSQSAEYCQLLDIFLSLSHEYEEEKFWVDCHCKVIMFGCDIFYRVSYLLLTVQICFVEMIKSTYFHLIDFVVFKTCYRIFGMNFLRAPLQNDKLNCAFF